MKKIIKKFKAKADLMFKDPAVNPDCAEFEVDNWLLSDFIISKLLDIVDIRPFPLNELMLMTATVCRLKPTHIFEWGTNIGVSARIFFETTKHFKIKTEIHSIDLPDTVEHQEHPHKDRGKLVKGFEGVFLHQGDGLDKSLELLKQNNIEKRVLFFLDGDHSYESVKRELSAIITAIPDAWILIHDTFYQAEESNYNIGPYKAVSDFLSGTDNLYKIYSQNLGLPGMTLLYKKFD
ncbi:MAG: class I SAM-dependent methyltransferase [Bacteroidota bacterium]